MKDGEIIQENVDISSIVWTEFPHLFRIGEGGRMAFPISPLTQKGREDDLDKGWSLYSQSSRWFRRLDPLTRDILLAGGRP